MILHSRKWILGMVVIALLVIVTACGQGTNLSKDGKRLVRIGYLPITHAAPLYLEDEFNEGKFDKFQLELVKFGSWPDLMDALNTGKIDGASVLIELAMKAKEQGIDLKAVALGHKDGNVMVVSPEINKVEDLKGKKFAIPHKFSTHNILLHLMLQQAGMKYSDVEAIELPPAEMPAALSEGRIAGYVVAEPFGANAVVIDKGKVLFQSEEIWPDSVDCGLVLRGAFIKKEREIAEEFVREYIAGGKKAELKDEHAKKVLSKYMNVSDKVLDLSLQWIKYDDLILDEASYEKLRKYMIEFNLSEHPPTFADFVDQTLIDKAMSSNG